MADTKTILLTGGSGFLGSFVLKLFLNRGYKVVAIRRENSDLGRIASVRDHKNLFFYLTGEINKIFNDHKIDFIVHTATCYGRNEEKFSDIIESNLAFPVKLLELGASSGVSGFLNADTFFNENLGLKAAEKCYVLTKKTFVSAVKIILANRPLKFINFRIEQMYGPGDNVKKFVPGVILKIINNERIALTAGAQKRDFIFVEDVAKAFLAAVEGFSRFSQYEEFGVGGGVSTSIKDAVETIKDLAGGEAVLAWGELPYRENEIMDSFADLSKNANLVWKPKVDLKSGLKKTIDFYRSRI